MTKEKLQVKKSSQGDVKLALLDERYKTMCQDINELKNDTKEIKDTVSGLKSSIDTLPEKLDKRYASKDTEIALKRLNWIVITAFAGALLALIINI
jgi:uncharacterized coiled-coil DUF342 family protein